MVPEIRIEDFDYALPGERIAKYPLPKRDSSKLLVYRDGNIGEHVFREIPEFLPKDSIMVFNDTKVVPARLHFQRETGAHIEIFCLEPVAPAEYSLIFSETEKCRWKCIVGNAKKWKSDVLTLSNPESDPDVAALGLKAKSVERNGETSIVEFLWNGGIPFSKVLETCGTIPIPPYLNRDSEAIDSQRYQTLYARFRGSVAAPTAGLHFTERVLNAIKEKGIDMETVCLHVGAGTFLPVKSETISGHTMHREPFVVRKKFIEDMAGTDRTVIAVGTTSVRTLESLYFAGVQWMKLNTKTGTITIQPGTDKDYVGVFQPRDGRDQLLYTLPETGISMMQVIPAVRNKVNTTDLNGPSAQPVWARGTYVGEVTLHFE